MLDLKETSSYTDAKMVNIILMNELFRTQMERLNGIYSSIALICWVIGRYIGRPIEDVYNEFNKDAENPEIISNRVIKLSDQMYLCIDIYHPAIDSPTAKIELIPSYYEDSDHEPGDCSPNMITIEVEGKDNFSMNDDIDTDDPFFKYVADDKDLIDKLNHIGREILMKGRWDK